mmetsp:Transcript_72460/g.207871  ORF Transcript_72460/g.207871 Transcript_72460/m.207871 type:complete len:268 (+) Transcript_72460:51-854(+)
MMRPARPLRSRHGRVAVSVVAAVGVMMLMTEQVGARLFAVRPSAQTLADGLRAPPRREPRVVRRAVAKWVEKQQSEEMQSVVKLIQAAKKSGDSGTLSVGVRRMQNLAEDGDKDAMCELGGFYLTGFGDIPKDLEAGLKWMEKAELAGCVKASFNLGVAKHSGALGVMENKPAASQHYRNAAKAGHFEAMMHLGSMLFRGEGIPVDRVNGYEWMMKGANGSGQLNELLKKVDDNTLDAESRMQMAKMVATIQNSGIDLSGKLKPNER